MARRSLPGCRPRLLWAGDNSAPSRVLCLFPKNKQRSIFLRSLRARVEATGPQTLLTNRIATHYSSAVDDRISSGEALVLARGHQPGNAAGSTAQAALFLAGTEDFLNGKSLAEEIFGPTTLVVQLNSREEMLAIAEGLEGHLTATIHAEEGELADYSNLVDILTRKVGRLLLNGYPTGVEVGYATVHGGPFPATGDGRSTSVGAQAIFRFARLVCFQDFPDPVLPDALKSSNPLGIWRLVDGEPTRAPLSIESV